MALCLLFMLVWNHLPFHQYHNAMPMWTEYSVCQLRKPSTSWSECHYYELCTIQPYTRTLLYDMFKNLSESPHAFCSLATRVQQGWAGVSNTDEESKTTLQHYPLNILHFLSQSFISKICQHFHFRKRNHDMYVLINIFLLINK